MRWTWRRGSGESAGLWRRGMPTRRAPGHSGRDGKRQAPPGGKSASSRTRFPGRCRGSRGVLRIAIAIPQPADSRPAVRRRRSRQESPCITRGASAPSGGRAPGQERGDERGRDADRLPGGLVPPGKKRTVAPCPGHDGHVLREELAGETRGLRRARPEDRAPGTVRDSRPVRGAGIGIAHRGEICRSRVAGGIAAPAEPAGVRRRLARASGGNVGRGGIPPGPGIAGRGARLRAAGIVTVIVAMGDRGERTARELHEEGEPRDDVPAGPHGRPLPRGLLIRAVHGPPVARRGHRS